MHILIIKLFFYVAKFINKIKIKDCELSSNLDLIILAVRFVLLFSSLIFCLLEADTKHNQKKYRKKQ